MMSTMTSGRTTGQSDENRTEVRPKPDGRRTKVRQKTLRIMFPLSSVAMVMAFAMLQQRWRLQCCNSDGVCNAATVMALQLATLLLLRRCCSYNAVGATRCGTVAATLLLQRTVALLVPRQVAATLLQRWRRGAASCCSDGGAAATLLLQGVAAVVLQRCCCRVLRRCCNVVVAAH